MKKYFIIIALFFLFFINVKTTKAEITLAQKLSGRILLQVQMHGEAWYVNPTDLKKYYLSRPADAFNIMRQLSIGITNINLAKIPQSRQKENNLTDNNFINQNSGKLFLQVESAGECWYVNPVDKKRYYLGRPNDAFNLMRQFGLGITNINLNNITTGYLSQPCATCQTNDEAAKIIGNAANAIRSNNISQALSYFVLKIQPAVTYTLNFLNSEGKLALANILSASQLTASTENEKIFTDYVYFNGDKIKVNFHLEKQADGQWLIANL